MAEAATGAKSPFQALGKKVGPLPLGVWLAGGLGMVWYFRKKQAQTGPGGTAAGGTTATGYGTDPAGNTGYIDPSTGYVYGSAEDVAALQSQGLVGAPATGSASGTGASGTSIDSGTGAVTSPSGTAVTTPGPGPGTPPAPTTGAPPAAGGKNWRYPAPAPQAYAVSDSGYSLRWNPVQGPGGQKPSGYTVQTFLGNRKVDQFTSGSTDTKEYGSGGVGLKPATTYTTLVWANGGPLAPPSGKVTVTTRPKGQK